MCRCRAFAATDSPRLFQEHLKIEVIPPSLNLAIAPHLKNTDDGQGDPFALEFERIDPPVENDPIIGTSVQNINLDPRHVLK